MEGPEGRECPVSGCSPAVGHQGPQDHSAHGAWAAVWGWVTSWHHSCLSSGWEERGPSEICQPTPPMPLCCLAPDPPSRDEGASLEDTLTVREPIPLRQNLSTPPGGTGTCLSCLASEDNPQAGDRQVPGRAAPSSGCTRFSCRTAFTAAHLLL